MPRTRRKHRRRSRTPLRTRLTRYWWLTFRRAPPAVQVIIALLAVLTLWFASNGLYQVIRKPSELFFPVSGVLYRTPGETWAAYEPIFRRHATTVMTPHLLAAIAQVEGSGNPVVRTYWRWSWSTHPFRVYRPASSAVGMYQITDGTFQIAKRYCIHDHAVVEDGPWNAWRSCWFNWLYARVVPSHAVEMTSAYLDRAVVEILARQRIRQATLAQKQTLVAVIHLCGAGAGNEFARRRFQLTGGQHCADHETRGYLRRVAVMQKVFRQLDARDPTVSTP